MKQSFVTQMEGLVAMFQRPDTGPDGVSYNFPTPGAIRGLIRAILHKGHLEIVPTRVDVLKPIKRMSVPQILWRASQINGGICRKDKNLHDPYGGVYLYDVAYRFHFDAFCTEERILRRLQRNLDEGAFYSAPFFGKRECVADIVPITDDPPDQSVTLVEPNLALSNNGTLAQVAAVEGVVDFTPHYDAVREALRTRRF